MANEFFIGWPMWEKLTFVLACAIVVTIVGGGCKLGHTQMKLRRYIAAAEAEKNEQAVQRQMSQRARPQASDEIPFGIRAIESGVEVDGVWISRPNTPEANSPQSSRGSWAVEHTRPAAADVDLEKGVAVSTEKVPKQQYSYRARSASGSTNASSAVTRPGTAPNISGKRLSSSLSSRNPSPEPTLAKPPKARHPPLSYRKYSNTPDLYRHSATVYTLQGLEAIHRASTSFDNGGGSGSSGSDNSGDDIGSISSAAPALLSDGARPQPRPRHKSADLLMLDTHRISQAAEMGQLTPKVRRPGQSRDSSVDYFPSQQRAITKPSTGDHSPSGSVSSPKMNALPAGVRRASMPDVTPFAQFCQTAPSSPRPEGYRPSSQEGVSISRPLSEAASVYTVATPSPLTSNPPTPPQSAQAEAGETSFEKRESQILRGHGSGFEILRPGSLYSLNQSEHPLLEQQRAVPPVSLQNQYRSRSSSTGGRAKLQKKRRPSADSSFGRRGRDSFA